MALYQGFFTWSSNSKTFFVFHYIFLQIFYKPTRPASVLDYSSTDIFLHYRNGIDRCRSFW